MLGINPLRVSIHLTSQQSTTLICLHPQPPLLLRYSKWNLHAGIAPWPMILSITWFSCLVAQLSSVEGPPTNETWAWNGHSWKQLHPASSPPALQGRSSIIQPADKSSSSLYQIQGGVNVTNEMWSWNGTTWQQLHPETMPEVVGASLAYSEAQHRSFSSAVEYHL